ncbi:hypothetical protein TrLO_g2109 [Triparma laevis f. longispina]|uniref:Uncharacterized protein n=1 Tax=Triparma laevis f. longispina TaxID=1714387 RepID=A0A9W7FL71_9STRA|nr:hypothetical protein TrLO_g2109 [Triparma laevis f. longispina]
MATIIDFNAEGVITKEMDKAKVNVWKSDTRTCMRMMLKPGWTWSACIGSNMTGQPTVCPGHHFGFL